MLRKEQNDLLTQTGPGTPMGLLFRSSWIPALLAEELPVNDCPPVRVKLLSERLVAFRDSDGRLGLIDELGLAVIPVVLGSGVPFFGTMASSTKLELLDCRPFPSGIVLLNYRVVRP